MTANGKSSPEIESYLDETKTKFYKRCNKQLREQTGKSFPIENNTIWTKIDSQRNQYRHKIAHLTLMPGEKETEKVMDSFELAVNWIETL